MSDENETDISNQTPDPTINNVAGDVAQAVEFEALSEPTVVNAVPDLEVILDIPVKLSVELGRTKISIRKLLELTQGSIIELDRQAGEYFDILANGTLIAHGEVVVVNEKFGIRLVDVLTPSERLEKIK